MKKIFKGKLNGKDFDNYNEYNAAKNTLIFNNELRSCSEEWTTVTEGDYCDKTECCNCTKEVKDCSCESEHYPDDMRLFWEDCKDSESAMYNDYISKTKDLTLKEFNDKVDHIRNKIKILNEVQLNEFLDDCDYIKDILRSDQEDIENYYEDLKEDYEKLANDINEARRDIDICKSIQCAYERFKRDAKEVLKQRIVNETKEHQANENRLKLATKKEAETQTEFKDVSYEKCRKEGEDMLDSLCKSFSKLLGFPVTKKDLLDFNDENFNINDLKLGDILKNLGL